MTTENLSFLMILKGWLTYGIEIWMLGWKVLFKAILASIIVSIFLVPFTFIQTALTYFGLLTSEPSTFSLILAGIFLLVYLPLVFYVAGSWVGFCKWIKDEKTEQGS